MSCADSAIPSAVEFPQADAGFPAGMIAVRAAGVICPGGAATALLVAGSPVASAEPLVFAHPVTMALAVVRRSGAVVSDLSMLSPKATFERYSPTVISTRSG
jgi:hypothetical protein